MEKYEGKITAYEVQVQRGVQTPDLLDIDHPPSSTRSTSRSSTPRRSPPSIATSGRKLLSNVNAWESPAFLKRNHFGSTRYSPFIEENDDFPDNDRRKRSKFGRGSGQWRFADRTPSPEKELEAEVFEDINTSSRPTASTGIKAPTSEYNAQTLEKLEPEGFFENEPLPHDLNAINIISESSPPSPPPTTVSSSPAQHLVKVDHVISSPGALTPSEIPQSLEQGSESDSKFNSETEKTNSASATSLIADFGLDGSALSRLKETSEKLLPPGHVDERVGEEEAHSDPEDSPEAMILSDHETSVGEEDEGITMEPRAVKESADDFRSLDDQSPADSEGPNHRVQASEQLQSDSVTVEKGFDGTESEQESEQVRELFEETSELLSDAEIEVSPQEVVEDEEASALRGVVLSNRQSPHVSIPEAAGRGAELQLSMLEAAEDGEEDSEPLVGLSRPDHPIGLEIEERIGEMRAGEAVLSAEKQNTKIEIIDLESEEEEEQSAPSITDATTRPPTVPVNTAVSQQPHSSPPNSHRAPDSVTNDLSDSSHNKSIGELKETIPKSDFITVQSPSRESVERFKTPEKQERDLLTNAPDAEIIPESNPLQQKDGPDSETKKEMSGTLPLEKQESRSQSPVRKAALEPQLGIKDEQISQDPLIELPSTIPESVQQPPTKSQLFTPDITQRTSFSSRASSPSLQTMPDDDTLPTPQLTQGNNDVGAIPTKLPPDPKSSSVREVRPTGTDGLILDVRGRGKSLTGVRQAPTLIEKLKAMRRLSSQTPQKIGDASAVSPWFAPKKPVQVVPDSEAESEVESVSDVDISTRRMSRNADFRTPEKNKSLAKSFIRSPPQREGVTSLTSSPGYLPPSQPPPPGFRTSLSYFVPLATLQSYFSLSVDILAIALSAADVTRATSGPKDYHQTIYLTDPSSEHSKTPITITQIFRSYNKCFPIIERGDALLLREFKVQSFQRHMALLSTQSSAWAVFRKHADVQIRGPPVELGAEERGFARGLWRWWDGLGQEAKKRLDQIVPKAEEKRTGSETSTNGLTKIEGQETKGIAKKEALAGLGVDLPGSQEKSRKVESKGRGIDEEKIIESVEPPKRVLRPRGARGRPEKSESPAKAIDRRSGTVFTGGLGEPDSE